MDKLRKLILNASYESGACHIGSALSCIDILVEIFNKKKENDLFIFSKASGVAAYYAILAEKGIIPENKVAYYLKNYPLVSKEVPSVLWSGGSLGHGLPVAAGLALADRTRDVYVMMSDGEIQEGTTWESAMFASHHKLKNLKVYIDKNGLQACGATKDILDIEDLVIKFSAFGWNIMNLKNKRHGIFCNRDERIYPKEGGGYIETFDCDCLKEWHKDYIPKPEVWIMKTIKAKGWPEMEGKIESHYKNITKQQLDGLTK